MTGSMFKFVSPIALNDWSNLFSTAQPGPDAAASDPGQIVLYSPDGGSSILVGSAVVGTGSLGVSASGIATSPFVINLSWDDSVASAPAGFKPAVLAAAQYLETQFTDAVTINISVGYGEAYGTSLGSGTLGASVSYLTSASYHTLRTALANDVTTLDDRAAVASLPTTAPTTGTLWTTTANAKAIGLVSATSTSTDGYIGFSSSLPFTYSGAVAGGTYDFMGVALHELTEVMGRGMLTGGTVGSTTNSYELMDLFHYSAAGTRDFSASTPGYFSPDGGTTNLGALNTASNGDAGDWSSSMGNDSFDAFSNANVTNTMSSADLRVMDTLGWNLASAATMVGLTLSPATGNVSTARNGAGLGAATILSAVNEVGGPATDTYKMTLSGTGAALFKMSGTGPTQFLRVGAAGLPGSASGTLYSLKITATDVTQSTAAAKVIASVSLVVIGGTSGDDTISVATLSGGLGTAVPTFVYGLDGNDVINAGGLSGPLVMVGGAGADRMTGGSGGTDYIYGAVADSTAASMDVITNFQASTDLIDLTGLGSALAYAGAITGGAKLAAHSIGWQTSGGNTFVYVNTFAGARAVTAASMKIELLGAVAPSESNFLHL